MSVKRELMKYIINNRIMVFHSHKTDDFAIFMGIERCSQCTKSKMQVVEKE